MRFLKSLSCALLVLMLPLAASASSVSSMTPETVVSGPDGSNYVESSVNCRGTNEPRTIWRKESESEWCPKEVEGYCSRQKIRVAQRVCGREHAARLEELRSTGGALQAEALEQVAEPAQPVADPAPAVAEPEPAAVEPAADEATVEESVIEAAPPVAAAQQAGSELEGSELEGSEQEGSEQEGTGVEDKQRQLEIERERLKIEQERLELRRQQVELQKQELELQRQLESKQQVPTADAAPAAPVARDPVRSESTSGGNPHRSVLGM